MKWQPPVKKVLQVYADGYIAQADWANVKGRWFTSSIIDKNLLWMHGMTPEQAKAALTERGAVWSWL